MNLEARQSKLTASGASGEDGGLLLNNIVPEIYALNVMVPDGYYLKSAKYGETDVLRSALDLSNGASRQLELEIGTDGGRIDGSVTDGEGRQLDGARVALIPEDASSPSRPKVVLTNAEGAFRIRGIAPGDYKLYASRNLDLEVLRDPTYNKPLDPQGNSVSVKAHGTDILLVKAISEEALPARSSR